ncbi:MAG: insulinase family protein [Deltaproteobacteria bacterium]|nr:MAG: insulinase family protein [Deltaproteobacteria bacterium]
MSTRQPHFEVFDNGLSVLLLEAHEAPVVAVQIWVGVGSADERAGEEGLAHFHEHMLFKGTERRGVGAIAGEIEGVGGRVNAYTSYDLTVYHATLPSAQLEVGLDVLADAVQASVFDPAEIEREIEVVLEEIRRSEDSPPRVLEQAAMTETYRVHPYRHPILGTRESVASLDRERLVSFFQRWYAPDNLTVVITGAFETPRVVEAVRNRFAAAAPARTARVRAPEPPQESLRSVVLQRDFERASLEFYFPTVGLAHPDAALLDLLAFVLGQGDSSRLVRRVKENEGLAEAIDASSFTPLDPGVFAVSVDLDASRVSDAIAAVMREIERLRAVPVLADELEKARVNFLAHEHFERESVGGLARKLGNFQALCGSYRAEAAYFDAVRRATPADLQRVARTHLGPERATLGALLPSRADVRLDDAAVRAAVERGVASTRAAFGAPTRVSAAAPDSGIRSFRLPNGGALHVAPRRDIPIVALRAALLGGLLAEDDARAGLTSFASSMLLRGTRSRSAGDFARTVESLAADVDAFSGRNSFGLTLEATTDSFDRALELFGEALLEPAFAEDEIERERRDTLAAIERREDRLASRVFQLFAATHYRKHPYRLPLLGTRESVASFNRDDIAAHHARLVCGPNLVLGVAGDVDPDALAARLSTLLADLDNREFSPPSPPLEPEPSEVRVDEIRKEREQAHLVLGFRGLTVADEDRFALEVLVQILAGQSGRLFLELRDRQSLAYTVSATNVEAVAPGFLVFYIATAPDKFEQARSGILEELEKVLGGPPSEAERSRAQHYLVGNFTIDEQRRAVRAAHLSLDALYGLGPDADREYGDRIRAVTREDVLQVARRVIRLDAYTLASIRP